MTFCAKFACKWPFLKLIAFLAQFFQKSLPKPLNSPHLCTPMFICVSQK